MYVPVSFQWRKFDQNAYIGYVLGYREDFARCKLYVPYSRTTRFVADVGVDEDIFLKTDLLQSHLSVLTIEAPLAILVVMTGTAMFIETDIQDLHSAHMSQIVSRMRPWIKRSQQQYERFWQRS